MSKLLSAAAFFVCVSIFFGTSVSAQKSKLKKMKYETELCEIEGTYDSSKYTEAQLRNTLMLANAVGSVPLQTNDIVFKYEDIAKLNVADLDREYRETMKKLRELDIVKTEYWEQLRQARLRETEQTYKLSRLLMQGYTDPERLLEAENDGECRADYAEPLVAGGDTLLATWKKVHLKQKANNGDPDRLQRIFDQQFNSTDKFKFAAVEVTTFGWWNCVVGKIERPGERFEKSRTDFEKLFVKLKEIYCDEP